MLYVCTSEVVKYTITEMMKGAKMNFQDGSINTQRWTSPKKLFTQLYPNLHVIPAVVQYSCSLKNISARFWAQTNQFAGNSTYSTLNK